MPSRACPCVRECCIRLRELLAGGGVVGQPTRILLAGGRDSPILCTPYSRPLAGPYTPDRGGLLSPCRFALPRRSLRYRSAAAAAADRTSTSHTHLSTPPRTHTHTHTDSVGPRNPSPRAPPGLKRPPPEI